MLFLICTYPGCSPVTLTWYIWSFLSSDRVLGFTRIKSSCCVQNCNSISRPAASPWIDTSNVEVSLMSKDRSADDAMIVGSSPATIVTLTETSNHIVQRIDIALVILLIWVANAFPNWSTRKKERSQLGGFSYCGTMDESVNWKPLWSWIWRCKEAKEKNDMGVNRVLATLIRGVINDKARII